MAMGGRSGVSGVARHLRDCAELASEQAPWELREVYSHPSSAGVAGELPAGWSQPPSLTSQPDSGGRGNPADGLQLDSRSVLDTRRLIQKRKRIAQKLNPEGFTRCAHCGRPIGSSDVGMMVGYDADGHRKASYQGVEHCASVWVCPECAWKILHERGTEVHEAMERHFAVEGHMGLLVTCTARHHKGQALSALLDAESTTWSYVTGSRRYRRWAKEHGLIGFIKTLEITVGENGWHPHFHMIPLFDRMLSEEEIDEYEQMVSELWARGLVKNGLEAPNEHGVDVKPIGADWQRAAADYVTKYVLGFADEVSNPDAKTAKMGNRTPWQLLDTGDVEDVEKWQEYGTATKGKRRVYMTPGLRDKLGMGKSKTDEEIIEEEARDDLHREVVIDRASYAHVQREVPELLADAKCAVERFDYRHVARIFGCGIRVRPDRETTCDPRERGIEPFVLARHGDFMPMRDDERYIVELRPEYLGEPVDDAALALVGSARKRRLLPSERPPDGRAERHRRGRASDGAEGNGSPPGRSGAVGTVAGERRVATEGKQMAIAI